MGKVKFGQRLKAGSTQTGVGVSFVKIYHTQLKKKECLLYQDESAKWVFTPPPIVSCQIKRKLTSYSIRAELYTLGSKRGCYERFLWEVPIRGNSKCQVCNSIEEIDTFTNTDTRESFDIINHLCYNDKCLVYLLTCKVCHKQYTRKTVDRFRLRWNN